MFPDFEARPHSSLSTAAGAELRCLPQSNVLTSSLTLKTEYHADAAPSHRRTLTRRTASCPATAATGGSTRSTTMGPRTKTLPSRPSELLVSSGVEMARALPVRELRACNIGVYVPPTVCSCKTSDEKRFTTRDGSHNEPRHADAGSDVTGPLSTTLRKPHLAAERCYTHNDVTPFAVEFGVKGSPVSWPGALVLNALCACLLVASTVRQTERGSTERSCRRSFSNDDHSTAAHDGWSVPQVQTGGDPSGSAAGASPTRAIAVASMSSSRGRAVRRARQCVGGQLDPRRSEASDRRHRGSRLRSD